MMGKEFVLDFRVDSFVFFLLSLAILHSQQGLTRWFATKWPTVLVHYIVIKLFRGGIPSGTSKSHSAEVNPISWLIRTPAQINAAEGRFVVLSLIIPLNNSLSRMVVVFVTLFSLAEITTPPPPLHTSQTYQ